MRLDIRVFLLRSTKCMFGKAGHYSKLQSFPFMATIFYIVDSHLSSLFLWSQNLWSYSSVEHSWHLVKESERLRIEVPHSHFSLPQNLRGKAEDLKAIFSIKALQKLKVCPTSKNKDQVSSGWHNINCMLTLLTSCSSVAFITCWRHLWNF